MNNKKIVYRQVYEILNTIDDHRIPEEIMTNLEKEMDIQYKFDIRKEELLEESKNILSAIYTDYLATEEEKQITLKLEEIYMKKEEQMKKEKYDIDVFKKNDLKKQEGTAEIIIKEKYSLIRKLLNVIKSLFKR